MDSAEICLANGWQSAAILELSARWPSAAERRSSEHTATVLTAQIPPGALPMSLRKTAPVPGANETSSLDEAPIKIDNSGARLLWMAQDSWSELVKIQLMA